MAELLPEELKGALRVVKAILSKTEASAPPAKRNKRSSNGDGDEEEAVLEQAVATIERYGRESGFGNRALKKVLERAISCAHSGTLQRLQLQRRLLRAAAPATTVNPESVVRVGSALTSVPLRARLPLLEWLCAAWPSLQPRALRSIYFALFQQLQFTTLLEPAACLLCKISDSSDVIPFRLRKLCVGDREKLSSLEVFLVWLLH